jgi:hypothetical protein
VKNHRNCKVVTEGYEIEVVECVCGFHMGIDATYLDKVDGVSTPCPSCGITLVIPGFGELDGENTPKHTIPKETK